MKERMKTSHKVIIGLTALLVAALVGIVIWLSIWVHNESLRADNTRRQMENVYTSALYDSLDSVGEMENNLAKLLVSSSDSESISIAADVQKCASSAAEVVGRLPVDMYEHTGLQKFLNQVGDFAASYIRAVGSGAADDYDSKIEDIYAATVGVREQLSEAAARIGTDGYSVITDVEAGNLNVSGKEMNVEYPSIIYDGPFSDADNRCWKGLENLPEIGENDALAIVREKLGIDGRVYGVSEGDEAMYEIVGTASDGCESYVSVTKKGGLIASAFLCSEGQGVEGEEVDSEKARQIAVELGYDESLVPVWYIASDGVAVVNLAPEKDGVVYYTDLIKIKLGGGKLLGIEACGYCANHSERTYPPARMTPASAASCVSKKLTVTSTRLAVIPMNSSEVLCYEVAGTYKGLDYFVYVDAVNGKQVDIMRVIDSEQGKLVI